MKKIIILFLALALFSCKNKTDEQAKEALKGKEPNVWISGQIEGAKNVNVKLIVTLQQGDVTLGETTTDGSGNYELQGAINGLGIYQLMFDNSKQKIVPIPANNEDKFEVNGHFSTIDRLPKFKGISWGENLSQFFVYFNEFATKQEPIIANPALGDEQKIAQLLELRKPLDIFAQKSIRNNPASAANLIYYTALTPAMGFQFWDPTNLEPLRLMAEAFKKSYPDSPFGTSVEKQYQQIVAGYEEYKNYQVNGGKSTIGSEKAPEISLPNPDGKIMKLSELKGKYVLVDFWASWCTPCRRENPNVVKMYDKYKSKGFEIFSVSLDKDKEAWKRAIQSDNLKWKYHVSDLKQWDSSVIPLYGIESIPYTILLDPKGNVVATNLRGAALEQKLSELLK
jgi:thiol-disulfide isomerase/thioredoxin